jgi:predicted nucleic acid-binding protein
MDPFRWTLARRRGQLIGPNDLWIAAHAIGSGLVLVIAGFRIENWAK